MSLAQHEKGLCRPTLNELKGDEADHFLDFDRHTSQHHAVCRSREHMRLNPTNKLSLFAVPQAINAANAAIMHGCA